YGGDDGACCNTPLADRPRRRPSSTTPENSKWRCVAAGRHPPSGSRSPKCGHTAAGTEVTGQLCPSRLRTAWADSQLLAIAPARCLRGWRDRKSVVEGKSGGGGGGGGTQ